MTSDTVAFERLEPQDIVALAGPLATFLAGNISDAYITPSDLIHGRPADTRSAAFRKSVEAELRLRARTDAEFVVYVGRSHRSLVACAFCSVSPALRLGTVEDFAVATEGRRQGLGRRLMAFVEADLARSGVAELFLDVGVTNATAGAFFGGAGFTPRSTSMSKQIGTREPE